MRDLLESVATVLIAATAIAMFVLYLSDRGRNNAESNANGIPIDGWEQHNSSGIRLGREDAPIVITEFMDFTCPHCKTLAPVTDSLYRSFPNEVAVVFHSFPIRTRPFSMDLAVAAECALEQNRFWEFYRVIFSNPPIQARDELYELAKAAQVPDSTVFSQCLTRPEESFQRIRKAWDIGMETGVTGTPVVWVNGRLATARSFDNFLHAAQILGVDLESGGTFR